MPEGLTCFERLKAHQKRMRTINMVERVNQELKRRTHLIPIFPNVDSLMRVIIARLSACVRAFKYPQVFAAKF
jgi:putative transposase